MNERKIMFIVLIIIILIATIFLLIKINMPKNKTVAKTSNINVTNVYKNTIQTNNNSNTQEPKTVYIKSHKLNHNTIEGIVKNNSGRTVKNIVIKADCYDANGNKLSNSAFDSITELKANETWSFGLWVVSKTKSYKNLRIEYDK